MSVYCGECKKLIHVSTFKDWTTRKRYPEISCFDCGHGLRRTFFDY